MNHLDVRLVASQADAEFCSRLSAGLQQRGHGVVVRDGPSSGHREAEIVHAASLAVAASRGEPTDVISCRGAELELYDFQPEAAKARLREALTATRVAHCLSHESAERVRELAGERLAIAIIPPGAAAGDASSGGDGPLNLVAHADLTWLSGFDYLLAALARVRDGGVELTATVYGTGELLAPLRFSCDDLGLGDCVRVPGHARHAEVREALSRADVFVVTSHYESIHETAVEAMSMGVPVISTRVGGMSELVRDQVNGILVEPRDIESLAGTVRHLDRKRLRELGAAARAFVAWSFTLDAEIDGVEAMYRELRRGRP